MSSKVSVFAASWRQIIPGTTLFKQPLRASPALLLGLGAGYVLSLAMVKDRAIAPGLLGPRIAAQSQRLSHYFE